MHPCPWPHGNGRTINSMMMMMVIMMMMMMMIFRVVAY